MTDRLTEHVQITRTALLLSKRAVCDILPLALFWSKHDMFIDTWLNSPIIIRNNNLVYTVIEHILNNLNLSTFKYIHAFIFKNSVRKITSPHVHAKGKKKLHQLY